VLWLQAANAVGYGGESHQAILDATHTPKGSVDFFVELHIEQGPLLEKVSWGKLHQETASSGGAGAYRVLLLSHDTSYGQQWTLVGGAAHRSEATTGYVG
jgi:hypothetical protein